MRLALAVLSAAVLLAAPREPSGRGNYNIPLWEDGKVPLAAGDGPLDKPFLTVFTPEAGKGNGTAVVIAPGGSNIMLMYGVEGVDVAERFNDWGVTAFVLTYRLSPRYKEDARTLDGKRALEVVRSRAADWNLDPAKVGMIGFSAGSEITRYTVANSAPTERPAWTGLIYSVGRTSPAEQLKAFPPVFLCAAQADRGPSLASAQLFSELTRAGVTAELHLYQKGRHGFGSGFGSTEFGQWMAALKHFLELGGFLPAGSSRP